MDAAEFKVLRKRLEKTQRQMAQLLGTSIKAIHSYEQGWRSIPPHAERQILFLVAQKLSRQRPPCWEVVNCHLEDDSQCPAREFNLGELCWFINGTVCEGAAQSTWKDKMACCRTCEVFKRTFSRLQAHDQQESTAP